MHTSRNRQESLVKKFQLEADVEQNKAHKEKENCFIFQFLAGDSSNHAKKKTKQKKRDLYRKVLHFLHRGGGVYNLRVKLNALDRIPPESRSAAQILDPVLQLGVFRVLALYRTTSFL